MNRLRIAPIVEGDGEVIAVRTLLERIGVELAGAEYIEVLKPVRVSRTKLLPGKPGSVTVEPTEAERILRFVIEKLAQRQEVPMPHLILVLLDADYDCPADLAPRLMAAFGRVRGQVCVAVVLAVVEYESWFVAAATSLRRHLDLREGDEQCDAEREPQGKAWIASRLREGKYSETRHQVALTSAMDVHLCRSRSSSFDKLCREVEAALKRRPADNPEREGP